jgi:hypothetical protein
LYCTSQGSGRKLSTGNTSTFSVEYVAIYITIKIVLIPQEHPMRSIIFEMEYITTWPDSGARDDLKNRK